MKSYYIHLLRHGTTTANETGQYIGSTDIPLSNSGKNDLYNILKTHTYPKINTLYSSPLKRCTQTCKILYPNMDYTTINEFKELNFGNWEGKTANELKSNINFTNWLADSYKYGPPNGETGIQFAHRICSAFENLVTQLMKQGNTNVGLITHSGVISTLLAAYGLPKASPLDWITSSGCGYSVRITPNLWMRDMVMEVYQTLPL